MHLWGHGRWQQLHEEKDLLPSKARPDGVPGLMECICHHKQDTFLVPVENLVT